MKIRAFCRFFERYFINFCIEFVGIGEVEFQTGFLIVIVGNVGGVVSQRTGTDNDRDPPCACKEALKPGAARRGQGLRSVATGRDRGGSAAARAHLYGSVDKGSRLHPPVATQPAGAGSRRRATPRSTRCACRFHHADASLTVRARHAAFDEVWRAPRHDMCLACATP